MLAGTGVDLNRNELQFQLYLPNLFLFCVEVALLYLIALMSNYKVKAAFLLFNRNFKERRVLILLT